MTRRALSLAAFAALTLLGSPALNADVLRDSTGPRRAALDKLKR